MTSFMILHAVLPSSQIVYISQGQQSDPDPAPPEVINIYVCVNFNHQNKIQKEHACTCTTKRVDRCTPWNVEYPARSERRNEI